jgi:hypothetical protein
LTPWSLSGGAPPAPWSPPRSVAAGPMPQQPGGPPPATWRDRREGCRQPPCLQSPRRHPPTSTGLTSHGIAGPARRSSTTGVASSATGAGKLGHGHRGEPAVRRVAPPCVWRLKKTQKVGPTRQWWRRCRMSIHIAWRSKRKRKSRNL